MEKITKKVTVFALILGFTLMISPGFLSKALGGAGDTLDIRPGQFTTKTRLVLNLNLEVEEVTSGRGKVTLLLGIEGGPNLLCSAHGPRPMVNFGDGTGNNPLPGIQCGTAFGMPVSIDRCKAQLEAHGYAHIHHPKVTYMGMMTVELSFKKRSGLEEGNVKIKVHTPKTTAKFNGIISDTDLVSDIAMSSCP